VKRCGKCRVLKPLDQFYYRSRAKSKLDYQCKACKNTYSRKTVLARTGMTPITYEEKVAAQGGVCAICKGACSTYKHLSVDHCHTTGKFRGLLCGNCNRGLGLFQDNATVLKNAIDYLTKENV
jgi:hypothetical protein